MTIFGRVITAMVTPFDAKGNIDFQKTTQLVEYLIKNGSDGLVVSGTTGESPTLTTEEKIALFKHVVKIVDKRILSLPEQAITIRKNPLSLQKKRKQPVWTVLC